MRIAIVLALLLFVASFAGAVLHDDLGIVPSAPEVLVLEGTGVVALTPLAELLGWSVVREDDRITVSCAGHAFRCTAGSRKAEADGRAVTLPLAPFFRADEPYLPLRPCVEALGGTLAGDAKIMTVSFGGDSLALPVVTSPLRAEEFFDDDWELFVMHLDGSGLQRLTYDSRRHNTPEITPDGKHLIFDEYGDHGYVFFRPTGSPVETHLRVPDNMTTSDPILDPTGKRVLFSAREHQADGNVRGWFGVAGADGQAMRTWVIGAEPAFNPDGTLIAYTTHDDGEAYVAIVKVGGDGLGLLAPGTEPHFSRDGKQLVFRRYEQGKSMLWLMNLDGTGARRLGEGESPVFTPDDRYLIAKREYAVKPDESVSMLVTIPLTGEPATVYEATPEQRTHAESLCEFTPDGKMLVVRENDGVYLMNPDRSGEQRLWGHPGLWHAMYTPVTRELIVDIIGNDVERSQLLHVDPQTGQVTPITPGILDVPNYTLTPDGRHLLFSAIPQKGVTGPRVAAPKPASGLQIVPALPELFLYQGTVFTPLQPLAGLLGGRFAATAGSTEAQVNGQRLTLPAAALRLDGAVYVPFAPLARACGWAVTVDTKAKEVIAFRPNLLPLHLPLVAVGAKLEQGRDNDTELYVVDIDGANNRRLTWDTERTGLPAITPDGRWIIAWQRDMHELTLRAAADPRASRLSNRKEWFNSTFHDDLNRSPQLLPDGSRMIFTRGYGENALIYSLCPDGTGYQWLQSDARAVPSPDGARIAFTRDGKVCIMDSDGWNTRELTDAADGPVQFSPDGTLLMFFTANTGTSAIYHMAGQQAGTVTHIPFVQNLAFRPDGKKVAYTKTDEERRVFLPWQAAVFQSNLDFSGEEVLVANIDADALCFTADGEYLLFIRRNGDGDQLCRMSAAGGAVTPLCSAADIAEFAPAPGGKQILYTASLSRNLDSGYAPPDSWALP